MRNPATGTLHTTAFRVAAVYAVVYAVLTGAIVVVVFSLAEKQIYTQIRDGLIDESTAITSLLELRGPEILEEIVHIRSAQETSAGSTGVAIHDLRYYLLSDADNRILVGDLPAWPQGAPASGWYRFRTREPGEQSETLALITTLPNGMHLLVGQSLATPNALADAVKLWVAISAALALLAGLAGGTAIGTRVMRKIRETSATAERIRAGRLSERLVSGGPSEQSVLASSFNSMLDRIETAVLGLRDLAARTAHEMKHPLTRADQALARTAGLQDIPGIRAEIADARGEITDLARRIDALLRLARMEAGDAPEFFGDVDLAKLASDVVELYSPFAEESGRSLSLETASASQFSGDRQLLAQALANLVDNAIKYSPEGHGIIVRLRSGTGSCELEVEDTGSGPGYAQPPHPGSTGQAPGAGLGLAITRAIARLHGGELELERRNGGFTARIRLPR
jgi:signal transduction histidine kinase